MSSGGLIASFLLAAALLAPGGCLEHTSHVERIDDGYDAGCRDTAARGPYYPSICVARSLSYSSDRAKVLTELAGKPDLCEADQMAIADAAVEADMFSSDQTEVLITLARNPIITEACRNHIARRTARLSMFSSDRLRLAEALMPPPGSPGSSPPQP